MSHCHGQSCETQEKQSSHGAQGGCGCKSCGCHSSACGCKSCCESEDKAKKLLAIADMAWMEVLKDKIKEHILSTDKKIDEMAKIVAQTNHDRWAHKMAKKQCMEHYEESLSQLLDAHHRELHSSYHQDSHSQSPTSNRLQNNLGQTNPPSPPRQY